MACVSTLCTGFVNASIRMLKAWYKGEFKDISLSDYKGKYVLLFFYPADFTFVCPTEIIEFSKKSPEFRKTSKFC